MLEKYNCSRCPFWQTMDMHGGSIDNIHGFFIMTSSFALETLTMLVAMMDFVFCYANDADGFVTTVTVTSYEHGFDNDDDDEDEDDDDDDDDDDAANDDDDGGGGGGGDNDVGDHER